MRAVRRCPTGRSRRSHFTMSNSVRFFVPVPQSCVRVLAVFLHPRCVRLVTRPRNEGAGGAPGGVLPVVALVGRDATLARRGASRAKPGPRLSALHRGVVGPGTAPDAPIPAIRPVGCSRPAIVHGGLRHRAFSYPRFTSRGRRHSPLRLLDRLRRRPLMSEDGESILHLHIVVNR